MMSEFELILQMYGSTRAMLASTLPSERQYLELELCYCRAAANCGSYAILLRQPRAA